MSAMDIEAPSAVGAAEMAALPVASRVNFALFQQAPLGSPVRVGGRLAGARTRAVQMMAMGIWQRFAQWFWRPLPWRP